MTGRTSPRLSASVKANGREVLGMAACTSDYIDGYVDGCNRTPPRDEANTSDDYAEGYEEGQEEGLADQLGANGAPLVATKYLDVTGG